MPHAGANSKHVVLLAPVLVDNTAANTTTAGADTLGFDRVKIIYQLGGMVNGAVLSSWAVESNESNLGNATNVVSAENTSVQAKLTNVANTNNNSVQVLDIYRPTKRYVGAVVDAASANITLLGITAELSRGTGNAPITAPSGGQYVSFRAS